MTEEVLSRERNAYRQRRVSPLPLRRMSRRKKAAPSAGPQDEPLVNLNARISPSLRRRLRLQCVEQGCRMDHFVAQAIREALRRRPR
jgi:predicted HicB family RNase H-like nuclease